MVVMMLIMVNFRMLSMMVRAPWMRELMMGSSAEIAREKVSSGPRGYRRNLVPRGSTGPIRVRQEGPPALVPAT